ncbi:membrane protein YczE [Saccharopolyspora sp. 5N708]|uniref:membrane protein YczE n=1 Tax=Saccharopolyspora sp. 5N708 TaxID=3457424 RepID=UPI003FD4CBEB
MASISALVDLSPLSIRTRPLPRLGQLLGGLVLYGASMGFMVRAQLGLDPWDVLHQGLAQRLGWSFGTITALTGVAVLLAWLPLRQRPGIGTVANVVVIAVAVDATLALTPPVDALLGQISLMIAAIVLNGIATAVYVGARLGPGPRDGLMTGLHARTGWSVRVVRTVIELCVLTTGWLLGGTVGVGTVLYALAIGPLTQFFLRFATVREKKDLCP